MSGNTNQEWPEWFRRTVLKGAAATGAAIGLPAVAGQQTDESEDTVVTSEEQPELPDAGQRIDLAERVGPRDFNEEN